MWWHRPEIPSARRQRQRQGDSLTVCTTVPHIRIRGCTLEERRRRRQRSMRKRKQSKKRKKSSGCVDGRQREGEEEGRKKKQGEKEYFPFYD